jgi:hypothetical protein
MTLITKHREELVQAELQISRTLLVIGQSKLVNQDTNGALHAVRNAEAAIEGIGDLLDALEISNHARHLREELYDLHKLIENLRKKISVAGRTLAQGSTTDLL